MTSIISVAKYLLEESNGLSAMKLQKLCYFIQGWHLVINNAPLFNEDFESWKYGPVCPDLYNLHARMSYIPADSLNFSNLNVDITEYQKKFIDAIASIYMPYSALQLSDISHQHKSWINAGSGSKTHSVMSKDSIKKDFQVILEGTPQ